MKVTPLLTAFVAACLFWGAMPPAGVAAVCILLAGTLFFFGHHSHGGVLTIDVLAHRSRLSAISPGFKVLSSVILLVLCVCSRDPIPPAILFVAVSVITIFAGGTEAHDYLSLLTLPAVFLLVSGVALLWGWSGSPEGVISVECFGGWLVVTKASQELARLVMSRTLGALSCLYFMSLTTPMSEIIEVMRRVRVPAAILDLVVLIYRYIFMLLSTYQSMRNAAESRLGFTDYRTAMRTTGFIYSNLLAKSFRKADACMDAMDSRCFDGGIRFLESPKPVPAAALAVSLAMIGGMLAAAVYCR